MGDLIVVRVASTGVIVSPEGYRDEELVERVKMLARATRRLSRLLGFSESRVLVEWSGGRAVFRVGEEDLLAVITLREPLDVRKHGVEGAPRGAANPAGSSRP